MKFPLWLGVLLISVSLFVGCQLPATTKANARAYPVGESFIVDAPFTSVARYWDENAVKPANLLGNTVYGSLQVYEKDGIAQIIDGSPSAISAMIELRDVDGSSTEVTLYRPVKYMGQSSLIEGWLSLIRSTPKGASRLGNL